MAIYRGVFCARRSREMEKQGRHGAELDSMQSAGMTLCGWDVSIQAQLQAATRHAQRQGPRWEHRGQG